MRAFIGEFDRLTLGVFLGGVGIGAVWLVQPGLGLLLATAALLVGSIALIIHRRWIEIGLLLLAIGLVVQVGYSVLGVPDVPPVVDPESGVVPVEVYAPGMGGLLLIAVMVFTIVIGAWDMAEARRRERLDEGHRRRRANQIAGS